MVFAADRTHPRKVDWHCARNGGIPDDDPAAALLHLGDRVLGAVDRRHHVHLVDLEQDLVVDRREPGRIRRESRALPASVVEEDVELAVGSDGGCNQGLDVLEFGHIGGHHGAAE